MSAIVKKEKILIILTSTPNLKRGEEAFDNIEFRTGFDMKEVGYIWKHLGHLEEKFELVFASPKGGEAPIDPSSMEDAKRDENLKDLFGREGEMLRKLLERIKGTKAIHEILREEIAGILDGQAQGGKTTKAHFRWVMVPGCRGAMFDLAENHDVAKVIECVLKNGGCVATIGHGLAALLNVRAVAPDTFFTSTGAPATEEYFLKGKKVTCSTEEEEEKMPHKDLLPFSLEKRVREHGARVEKDKPFGIKVVTEKHLITAQNRPSAQEWIKTIMNYIEKQQ